MSSFYKLSIIGPWHPQLLNVLHKTYTCQVKIRPALKSSYLFNSVEKGKDDNWKIIMICENNYSCALFLQNTPS